jgi:hypothetical protein
MALHILAARKIDVRRCGLAVLKWPILPAGSGELVNGGAERAPHQKVQQRD